MLERLRAQAAALARLAPRSCGRCPRAGATIDAQLDALLAPPQRLVDALQRAGAPIRLSELGVDATTPAGR